VNSIASPTALQDETTAVRASGSSFYAAMRILPRAQRDAMFEIYSFCRLVDDVADSAGPHALRLAQLREWRARIEDLFSRSPPSDLRGLAAAVARFGLRKQDFLAVIEGMEMDAAEDIRAPDWARLDQYCDRVASAVGRLSVRVFGMEENDGIALAHHLGRALQLTNILRELDEDAEMGRLYLPREALSAAGIASTEPATVLASPSLAEVCGAVVERARMHFAEADAIMARSPRAVVKAPRMMQGVYRPTLERMVERGWSAPRDRVRVSRAQLLWIALRYAIV
jgi:phytoene synthase